MDNKGQIEQGALALPNGAISGTCSPREKMSRSNGQLVYTLLDSHLRVQISSIHIPETFNYVELTGIRK